jgi:hypothetical protein
MAPPTNRCIVSTRGKCHLARTVGEEDGPMRMVVAAVLAGVVLASAGMLAGGGGPAIGGAERTAEFVRKTCTAALDDPANLERIAAAGHWPRFIDRASPQPDFMTVIGTWRAT